SWLLSGVFISSADSSIALATHGTIASEFKDLAYSSWIYTSFGLAAAASQPLLAKLSDIYGRKTVLQVSNALFALGCGIGSTFLQVIIGRIVSGIGGAAMTNLVFISIADFVPVREAAAWRGYVNVVSTAGRSLGGPLGGYLADVVGWRWQVFSSLSPTIVIAMILIWGIHPSDHTAADAAATEVTNDREKQSKLSRVDFLGSALLAITILAFMLPLEIGGQSVPWNHPFIWALLGVFVLCAVLLVLVEEYWAKEPVFPIGLMRNGDVVACYLVTMLQLAGQMGFMFSVPLYFQITARASAKVAGAHLFPAVAGNAVGGLMTGYLVKRSGRYKFLITLATVVAAISYLLVLLRWRGHTNLLESLYIIPGGFGTAIAQSAVFVAVSAAIDPAHMAVVTSGLYLFGSIGVVVGMTGASAVLQSVLRRALEDKFASLPDGKKFIERVLSDLAFVDGLVGWEREAVVGAYLRGLDWVYGLSLLFALISMVASLFIKERKL
ncbi:uncharacterized protein K452DRAFT_223371, partial [Aplosporella prunicola CBS 121167]